MVPRALAMLFLWVFGNAAVAFAEDGSERLHQQIDRLVRASHVGELAKPAAEHEWLRRIYLDLIGRTPTLDETRSSLAKEDGEKKSALIDVLLQSSEFDAYFANVLDLMFMERRQGNRIDQRDWQEFLRIAISENWPYDKIVREVLIADGTGAERGAAKFLLEREVEPNALTRDTSRIFMGRDLQCAQCHDHPNIDDYLQAEYYGLYAFVSRSYLFEDPKDNKKSYVGERAEGETEFESVFSTDAAASRTIPKVLNDLALDGEPSLDKQEAYLVTPAKDVAGVPRFSRRRQMARLLTHPSNRQFARNAANRFWAHMMGKGIVDPVDFDHRANPASHPELLDALTDGLVASKFDLRVFLKEIALSQTYQRSIDFPGLPEIIEVELLSQIDETKEAVTETGAEVHKAEINGAEYAEQLVAARETLAEHDQQIEASNAQLEKLQQRLDKLKKDARNLAKQQADKRTQIAALKEVAAAAKKAQKALPNDEALTTVSADFDSRVGKVQQQIEAAKKRIEANAGDQQAASTETTKVRQQLARTRAERIGLADMVAEARGAFQVFQRQLVKQQSRYVALEQKLAYLNLHQRLLHRRSEVKRFHDQLLAAENEISSLAGFDKLSSQLATLQGQETDLKAQRSELENSISQIKDGRVQATLAVENAETDLRLAWQRRFAVRGLKPLSPEQLAGATIAALNLRPRFEMEAEAEWKKTHKDTKRDATDREQRAENEALITKRVNQVTATFVAQFAAPGGAPQDVFSSTADQALFVSNDGKMQSWLSPSEGTVLHRLNTMSNANDIADEVYWSLLNRPPIPQEAQAVADYLELRSKDKANALREIAWGLLSSVEFRFNH